MAKRKAPKSLSEAGDRIDKLARELRSGKFRPQSNKQKDRGLKYPDGVARIRLPSGRIAVRRQQA